jgi:hypothetical protein
LTVGLLQEDADGFDPSDLQELGQNAIMILHPAALVILSVLAPQIATAAIQAERDDRTLELLAMTGLRPASVLLSTLLSRAVQMVFLYLGLLPAFALLPWLGGVGASDILISGLRTLTGALVLGTVALPIALATRGPSLSLTGVGSWFILCGLVVPARLAFRIHEIGNHWGISGDAGLAFFVPLAELGFTRIDRVFPVLGWWLVPPMLAFWAAVWRFRREHGTDHPGGRAFPGRWVLPAELVFLAIGWSIIELCPDDSNSIGDWMVPLAVILCVVASDAYLRTICWLLPRLAATRVQFDRTWSLLEPISWRELATRPHGPMNRVMGIATAAYVVIGLLFAMAAEPEVVIFWGVVGAASGLILTGVLITTTFAEEIRSRSWLLLRSTTLRAIHLSTAKIMSVGILVGPLFLAGFAFAVVPDEDLVFGTPYLEDRGLPDPIHRVVSAIFLLLWIGGAWLLHASGVATLILWIRRPAWMWVVGPAAALFAPMLVLFFTVVLLGIGSAWNIVNATERLAALVLPPLAPHLDWGFSPLAPQLLSVGLWWAFAVCALLLSGWAAQRDPA